MNKHKKIFLAGGGTGGHAGPVFAVYEKLRTFFPESDITVIGVGSEEEQAFLKNIPNYKLIKSGKLHRHFTLKNLAEMTKFVSGLFQSFWIIGKEKPAVLFSKGGYASLPVVLAAKFWGVPYFIHESDIVMGKVNLFMAKWAKKVFVSFPIENYKQIAREKIHFSGPILREGFLIENKKDRKVFGFDNNKPVILLTGGSQGSLNLSQNFIKAAKNLLESFNIIHQAGKHSLSVSEKFFEKLNENEKKQYYLTSFLGLKNGKDLMIDAINLADLVISRAGSTICELAIKEKPMLLVPWKHSAQKHQEKNADFFAKNEAAAVIDENLLSPEILEKTIAELFEKEKKLDTLAKKAALLFPKDGTEKICELILREVKSN